MKHENKGAYICLSFKHVDSIRAAPIDAQNLYDMPRLRFKASSRRLQAF